MNDTYTNLNFFAPVEEIVNILQDKTGTEDKQFFRVIVSYYFNVMAGMMRTTINTQDRGSFPVNMFAINLAGSGAGKTLSANMLEKDFLSGFRNEFMQNTFPTVSKDNLINIANTRAIALNTDPEVELVNTEAEFDTAGVYAFNFDSGTAPAVKQMRQMLMMADIGSLNFQMDEIANNFNANLELLDVFMQLFDVGLVKQKLIKNTKENTRNADLQGQTPANMLLFGTPSKLLIGNLEKDFIDWLETGFARRCFFSYAASGEITLNESAEEMFAKLSSTSSSQRVLTLNTAFTELATLHNYSKVIQVSKEISIELIKYNKFCIDKANSLPTHAAIEKAELVHRFWKTIKLAGAYAFIDGKSDIEMTHLEGAIALAEASGESFKQLMNRDRPHIRLAKYLADMGRPVTQADIVADLPFYKGTETARKEMLNLAIAYGYSHNISISKTTVEDVLLIEGKALQETSLDALILSHSKFLGEQYTPSTVPFDKLAQLTQADGMNWINHHVIDGLRKDTHCIAGFNLIVLDVDEYVPLSTAESLLSEYTFHSYTTKRHTEEHNRFRIIIPMSHTLELNKEDYRNFMLNVFKWLPFDVDTQTIDRPRKWLSHKGTHNNNVGDLLDVTMFIPNTNKANKLQTDLLDYDALNNMERWFLKSMEEGNRSNQFIRYALLLVDQNLDFEAIRGKIFALNSKLLNPLSETELLSTVLATTIKALNK